MPCGIAPQGFFYLFIYSLRTWIDAAAGLAGDEAADIEQLFDRAGVGDGRHAGDRRQQQSAKQPFLFRHLTLPVVMHGCARMGGHHHNAARCGCK